MRSSWRIDLAMIGILLLLLEFTNAHSERRNRVTYISKVEDPIIKTPSQRAHAHSELDIVFTLHNGDQDVKFTLEPNNDIIPEGAVVEYLDDNGEVERKELLVRKDYKVYKGNSWLRDDRGWTYAGWARIIIIRDGINPMFEGAFTLNGDAHHLLSRTNYLKTRHEFDPLVEEGGNEFMVVFRDSDIENTSQNEELKKRGDGVEDIMCPSDRLGYNVHPQNPINRMILEKPGSNGVWGSLGLDNLLGGGRGGLTRRQTDGDIFGGSGNSAGVNLRTTIGSTTGCPKTRLVALVGVATDCTYTGDFPAEADARSNIIKQLNSASDLYEKTFNITLGLAQLVISKANCPGTAPDTSKWNVPCSSSTTIENRLNLFSQWRGQRSNDSLALWTLLTTCETGSSVGLAWLGQLCQREATTNSQDGSYVSGVNVVARTSTEWKVIAHEIGHTMGAVHDCTSSTCVGNSASASMCCPFSTSTCDAGGRFIMNPSTSDSIQTFSPCSIGNVCSAIGRRSVDTTCLTSNRGVTIITERVCGNGIVEDGEDCDCGGTAGCGSNACCNPTTCKFVDKAVCDDSNEDCCKGCQFASSKIVCRASTGYCDPEEKCTGTSPTCPTDIVAKDGTDCTGGLKCASGQCTSRDQQCRTVMGRIATTNDTRSCDSSNCVLTCQSPEFGADMCLRMQQNFLDGTPCRGDGVCKNGYCTGSSTLGEVKSWIDKNRNIVIGVSAGVGALLLFSIVSCCLSRCRRGRRRPKNLAVYNSQQRDPHWQQLPPTTARSYTHPPPPAVIQPQRFHGHHGSETTAAHAYTGYTTRYA
ncbi:hypothetical protein K440DRAFT_594442 [Wilcoxina mikolae CBS 423.85]|nr:hypothetical protein K440DRAFT_594442 [Wilcoxina mikolae CBS 423.85]